MLFVDTKKPPANDSPMSAGKIYFYIDVKKWLSTNVLGLT
jgi:hypothetical protein